MSEIKGLEVKLDKKFDTIDKNYENIDKKLEQIDKQFDDLTGLMSGFANDVKKGFDEVKFVQSKHSVKLEILEAELKKQNEQYDHLVSTIDGFVKRIDDYEIELAARDHKIARLERWIQLLAQKANVELS